jgi:hypothetical protein
LFESSNSVAVGNIIQGRPLDKAEIKDAWPPELLPPPPKFFFLQYAAEPSIQSRPPSFCSVFALLLHTYCSIPVTPLEPRFPNYAAEPLMWDAAFRQQLLDGLVELGYAVESAFNDTPQDIEGVWLGGRFAVVQSRPQVRRTAACSCVAAYDVA